MAVGFGGCEGPVADALDEEALARDVDELACRTGVHHESLFAPRVLSAPVVTATPTAEAPHRYQQRSRQTRALWSTNEMAPPSRVACSESVSDKKRARAVPVPAEPETPSVEL